MYIDAFAATESLKVIYEINNAQDTNLEIPEGAIFICYHNFISNNRSLALTLEEGEVYRYKAILKDVMRSLLLYIPIFMKQFMMKFCGKGPLNATDAM